MTEKLTKEEKWDAIERLVDTEYDLHLDLAYSAIQDYSKGYAMGNNRARLVSIGIPDTFIKNYYEKTYKNGEEVPDLAEKFLDMAEYAEAAYKDYLQGYDVEDVNITLQKVMDNLMGIRGNLNFGAGKVEMWENEQRRKI